MQEPHERVIVSVGGSLIVPDEIDANFLKRFRELVIGKVQHGHSFVIITGGGRTARRYQDAGEQVAKLSAEDRDWLGIHATRMNAQLLRDIFADYAHPKVIHNPTADLEADEPVIIAAGWQPGWSTDYVATALAKNLGARKLANLSDIDFVYDADPKTHPDAKPLARVSWNEFRNLIPDHWDPGLSSPFDPVAAKEAEALSLEVAIMNGANLEEFGNYLDGKPFRGTVIS